MDLIILMPAYNEGKTISNVIEKALKNKDAKVLVVDDGSTDNTREIAQNAGAIVVSHPINRGLGAALSTGIATASKINREAIIVTLDADGQHDPSEVPIMINPIVNGNADVAIGSRFQNKNRDVPLNRRAANFAGNFFTWFLFGIWVSDSQSGFRSFKPGVAAMLNIRTSTMEVSSEIIREIVRLKLNMVEVPITVKYTKYSMSKGQGFFRGLETLWKLIVLKFFR